MQEEMAGVDLTGYGSAWKPLPKGCPGWWKPLAGDIALRQLASCRPECGCHQQLQDKEPGDLIEAGMEVGKAEEEGPAGARSWGLGVGGAWKSQHRRLHEACEAQEVMWPQRQPTGYSRGQCLAGG